MNIVCVICRDLIVPSDDIFHTPCGHIFHYTCLYQWLERSKTCPQCREKTTVNRIHRLYFNFMNNDSITEDRYTLQDKVDKLVFDLALKEKDVKHYSEKSERLERQTAQLKEEVTKVEHALKTKETAIHAYREQLNFLHLQITQVEEKEKQLASVKNELQTYKNVQQLLQGSEKEVKEILLRTRDQNSLATYITAMKRELLITMDKRREWRAKLKSLQQELSKVTMERNFLSGEQEKRKKLEEELLASETKILHLESKLRDLEQCRPTEKVRNNVNSMPAAASSSKHSTDCAKQVRVQNLLDDGTKQKDDHSTGNAESNKSSPYLPVKSVGVYDLDKRPQKRGLVKGSSILTKKSRIEQGNIQASMEVNIITYNGFGGHSKLENFPSSSGVRTKRK